VPGSPKHIVQLQCASERGKNTILKYCKEIKGGGGPTLRIFFDSLKSGTVCLPVPSTSQTSACTQGRCMPNYHLHSAKFILLPHRMGRTLHACTCDSGDHKAVMATLERGQHSTSQGCKNEGRLTAPLFMSAGTHPRS